MSEWYVNVDWKVKLSVAEAVRIHPGRLSKAVDLWRASLCCKVFEEYITKDNTAASTIESSLKVSKWKWRYVLVPYLSSMLSSTGEPTRLFQTLRDRGCNMLFYLTDKHVWWMNVALYRPICANFPIFPSSYCSVSVLKNSRALETRTDRLLIYCWRTSSRFLVHGFLRFYQQICEPIENPCLLLVRYSYLPTN